MRANLANAQNQWHSEEIKNYMTSLFQELYKQAPKGQPAGRAHFPVLKLSKHAEWYGPF